MIALGVPAGGQLERIGQRCEARHHRFEFGHARTRVPDELCRHVLKLQCGHRDAHVVLDLAGDAPELVHADCDSLIDLAHTALHFDGALL